MVEGFITIMKFKYTTYFVDMFIYIYFPPHKVVLTAYLVPPPTQICSVRNTCGLL